MHPSCIVCDALLEGGSPEAVLCPKCFLNFQAEREARRGGRRTTDPINHPAHYKSNGIEAIDVIEAFGLNFNLGNTVKYTLRAGRKADNAIEDLRKAAWYLDREINKLSVPVSQEPAK